jgi:magnesium transporter
VTVSAVVYSEAGIEEYDDLAAAKAAEGTTWVRVHEADDDEISAVADAFDIHRLAIDDVVNEVRPKTEEFAAYTFVLVKTAELTRGETTFEEEIREDPVGVFFGTDWVLTLAPRDDDPIGRVWNAVVRGDERLLQRGPDFTAYRIIDVVIDEYFTLLDRIGDGIEAIEEEVLTTTDIEVLEAINTVRRDLLSFRKLAWPTREALSVLARGDPDYVDEATEKYFRDVYDHLVHVVDLVETYRDLVSGARDIYLNTLSQSSNEVMKVLTVIATVFLPLTFIAGVYGMNFSGGPYNMPELGWTFGYPAVMLGMALVGLVMVWAFRERGYV